MGSFPEEAIPGWSLNGSGQAAGGENILGRGLRAETLKWTGTRRGGGPQTTGVARGASNFREELENVVCPSGCS